MCDKRNEGCYQWVALLAEGVDRNEAKDVFDSYCIYVALLAEGVDRNLNCLRQTRRCSESPSSRRAWIEMLHRGLFYLGNILSPSSRRAWIEMPREPG